MKRAIISDYKAASCYFRSSVEPPYRKALLQITERCNLHCAHCFLSSKNCGNTMSISAIQNMVIPKLKTLNVISVTLTGGEPFIHPDIIEIVRVLKKNGIRVGICTNGVLINNAQAEVLSEIDEVHINVSLDGFRPESHGRFRGDVDSFAETVKNIRYLGGLGLIQGLLVTPNNFAEINEYAEICEFAVQNRATYVLINPLSSMGRGVKVQKKLRASNEVMRRIRDLTLPFFNRIQVVYIRFPNDKKLPLSCCEAGNIIYVFADGEITACPYLIFAARTPQSLHKSEEFIIGNILKDVDVVDKINKYKFQEQYSLGESIICKDCSLNFQCGRGCPAAIVASGRRIDSGIDSELCPCLKILMLNPPR